MTKKNGESGVSEIFHIFHNILYVRIVPLSVGFFRDDFGIFVNFRLSSFHTCWTSPDFIVIVDYYPEGNRQSSLKSTLF